MTREEAKELLPIIQAFAAGKQIQDAIEGLTDWVDTDEINLEYEGQKNKTSHQARTKVQTIQKPRRVLAGNAETSSVWMVKIKNEWKI